MNTFKIHIINKIRLNAIVRNPNPDKKNIINDCKAQYGIVYFTKPSILHLILFLFSDIFTIGIIFNYSFKCITVLLIISFSLPDKEKTKLSKTLFLEPEGFLLHLIFLHKLGKNLRKTQVMLDLIQTSSIPHKKKNLDILLEELK
jgi:hypothetical protein